MYIFSIFHIAFNKRLLGCFMSDQKKNAQPPVDTALLILVLVLAVFGLIILLSASEYNGRVRFHDSAYYFKKQLFATSLGLGAMYIISTINYRFFVRLAPAAYLLSLLLSTTVLLVGQEINGSKRWLNLGHSFLPAFRVCQSRCHSLSHLADRKLSQTNGRLLVHVPHDADSAPHRRSGRFQQLKYRDHHSRNRCHSDFRFQSTLHAVRRARQCRHRFYRSLSRRRKLPSGTSRYLA